MISKHTPGPWQCNDGVTIAAQSPHGPAYTVAKVAFERPRDEFFANARLIAAAPELLEALQTIENWLSVSFVTTPQDMAQSFEEMYWTARRAIAKAKGQAE